LPQTCASSLVAMSTGLDLRIRGARTRLKGASVGEEYKESTSTGRGILLFTWRILGERRSILLLFYNSKVENEG